MQFINTARRDDLLKEQGFQITNCTDATKVQVGRQLGARYMLTGSITELGAHTGKQVRVSKKTDVYYQLTVEITDIETGLIVLRKQRDRLRRASRPIIGW
jgi:PBP1b-binding outer membrane lipoprotein LpoB